MNALQMAAFTLDLVGKLTPVIVAWLGYMAVQARNDRIQIREKLTEVAHSVNGMKTELVAATAKGSYLEGAKDATDEAKMDAKK